MAQDGFVQHTTWDRRGNVVPAVTGAGMETFVHVSAVVAPVMAPERMAAEALELEPMITQAVDVGHAIWVAVTAVGSVSLVNVTAAPAVVGPYMTSGASAVLLPVRRHFAGEGQEMPVNVAVPPGSVSA